MPSPPSLKLLFVCSRNEWRSRTAEEMLRGRSGYAVKSAGTEPSARIRVTTGMIGWADVIFVMERKHADCLRIQFGDALAGKRVECLRIPDEFTFMDPDLIASLESALDPYMAELDA